MTSWRRQFLPALAAKYKPKCYLSEKVKIHRKSEISAKLRIRIRYGLRRKMIGIGKRCWSMVGTISKYGSMWGHARCSKFGVNSILLWSRILSLGIRNESRRSMIRSFLVIRLYVWNFSRQYLSMVSITRGSWKNFHSMKKSGFTHL